MNVPFSVFKARRATPALVINGEDILAGLAANYIISFCYTDSTSDKADDLSIELADPQRTWMLRYMPKKGVECSASITVHDWAYPGDDKPFDCGIFYVQNVSFKGPPNCVSIKASSIPPNGVKDTKKFKAWENSDLKGIASEIATANGLTLFYDTKENPKVKRTDQTDKPDLQYLRERCKEAKLSLKIHKKQLVIYSEEEYEAREPAFQLVYGASNTLDFDFNSKTDDIYAKAENTFVNPETGKLTDTEFDPNDPRNPGATIPEGTYSKLKVNESVEHEPDALTSSSTGKEYIEAKQLVDADFFNDDSSANKGKGHKIKDNSERKCKAKLREKNKKEHQCSFKVHGNIEYLSGLCCQTVGYGIFDKKWFVESSTHDVSSGGYTTSLKLRGALKGY